MATIGRAGVGGARSCTALSTASKAKYRDAEKDKTGNAGNQAHRRRQDAAVPEVRAVFPERMGGRARLQEMQIDRGLA